MSTDRSWIQTFTGKKFYPLDPDPAQIDILDIAHSLAMQCRFNGHVKQFYSVAQHSVLLAKHFKRRGDELIYQKYALLHDASEAYLCDIPGPLKGLSAFAFYRQAEERLQAMIYRTFGLDCEPDCISTYDKCLCAGEADWLMVPLHPEWPRAAATIVVADEKPAGPSLAEAMFMQTFGELWKG